MNTTVDSTLFNSICIFGGTDSGFHDCYTSIASRVGKLIGEKKIRLIFGGANTGIMAAVANAAMKEGGHVIGIVPKCMEERDDTPITSQTVVAGNMHERRLKMYALSDAFLALPGGLGTLEETIEVLSWLNLEIIKGKPLLLIDVEGYWRPFQLMLKHMVDSGFMNHRVLDLFTVVYDPKDIFPIIENNIRAMREKLNALPDDYEIETAYLNLASHACAYELQKLASQQGFDWPDEIKAFDKLSEEIKELFDEIVKEKKEKGRLAEEYGDVLFALINLSRHLDIDYEEALNFANKKFKWRFKNMKDLIAHNNGSLHSLDFSEILNFWNSAKEAVGI